MGKVAAAAFFTMVAAALLAFGALQAGAGEACASEGSAAGPWAMYFGCGDAD
ncbi:MAG: hypothetical protein AAFR11_03520 [Pseudomonadota bacterium]